MGTYGLNGPDNYSDDIPWQDTISLLRLVQSDYQGARKQLEQVNQTLAERESLVSQRLQYALLASSGYRALCLIPYGTGIAESQMGKAILGGTLHHMALPGIMHLEVRCLGRFEVSSRWHHVSRWQSVKAKSVFQYFMTKPKEPIIKDVLMEILWPDCEPQAASNNLKAAIHGIRQTLSRLFSNQESFPFIHFMQGSYRVNPEVDLWIDVEAFEEYWEHGRCLEKEGNVVKAIKEYELAEALYHGDYLADEPYEEWTLLRREALKDIYLTILGKLADHSLEAADYESCIIYCQKILVKDPCREDAYQRLMRGYSRLGQRNRALRWYEICHRTIQAELDTAPDKQTTTLYQRLARGEPI